MTTEEVSKLQEAILHLHGQRVSILEEITRLHRIRNAIKVKSDVKLQLSRKLTEEFDRLRGRVDSLDTVDPLNLFAMAARIREVDVEYRHLDDVDTPWYNKLQTQNTKLVALEKQLRECISKLVPGE
jgi:hypothetical protein